MFSVCDVKFKIVNNLYIIINFVLGICKNEKLLFQFSKFKYRFFTKTLMFELEVTDQHSCNLSSPTSNGQARVCFRAFSAGS